MEVAVYHDRDEMVDVVSEHVVENRRERYVDKLVELTKKVDRPQYN